MAKNKISKYIWSIVILLIIIYIIWILKYVIYKIFYTTTLNEKLTLSKCGASSELIARCMISGRDGCNNNECSICDSNKKVPGIESTCIPKECIDLCE